jgi:hypothetical protein
MAVKLFFSKSARSCLLAQPTNRRVKFRLWMDAGAAIEPIAQFALPDGFELGDPILLFIQHWSPEFAATPEQWRGCTLRVSGNRQPRRPGQPMGQGIVSDNRQRQVVCAGILADRRACNSPGNELTAHAWWRHWVRCIDEARE